jgi:ABC-type phosphate transport system permease subunit
MEIGLKLALWFFGIVFGFFAFLVVMHFIRTSIAFLKKKFWKTEKNKGKNEKYKGT